MTKKEKNRRQLMACVLNCGSYLNGGNISMAREFYEKARAIDPDDARVVYLKEKYFPD